jgi:hypothetical protein
MYSSSFSHVTQVVSSDKTIHALYCISSTGLNRQGALILETFKSILVILSDVVRCGKLMCNFRKSLQSFPSLGCRRDFMLQILDQIS